MIFYHIAAKIKKTLECYKHQRKNKVGRFVLYNTGDPDCPLNVVGQVFAVEGSPPPMSDRALVGGRMRTIRILL